MCNSAPHVAQELLCALAPLWTLAATFVSLAEAITLRRSVPFFFAFQVVAVAVKYIECVGVVNNPSYNGAISVWRNHWCFFCKFDINDSRAFAFCIFVTCTLKSAFQVFGVKSVPNEAFILRRTLID